MKSHVSLLLTLLLTTTAVLAEGRVTINRQPRFNNTAPVQPVDPRALQQGQQRITGREGEINCLITDVTQYVGAAVRLRCHQPQQGVQFVEMSLNQKGAPLFMQAFANAAINGQTIRIAYQQVVTNPRCNSENACAQLVGTR